MNKKNTDVFIINNENDSYNLNWSKNMKNILIGVVVALLSSFSFANQNVTLTKISSEMGESLELYSALELFNNFEIALSDSTKKQKNNQNKKQQQNDNVMKTEVPQKEKTQVKQKEQTQTKERKRTQTPQKEKTQTREMEKTQGKQKNKTETKEKKKESTQQKNEGNKKNKHHK